MKLTFGNGLEFDGSEALTPAAGDAANEGAKEHGRSLFEVTGTYHLLPPIQLNEEAAGIASSFKPAMQPST